MGVFRCWCIIRIGYQTRIAGRPNRVRIIDWFIEHIKKHEGVWFARKDEIADWALKTPAITPQVKRQPAPISGLPGSSH